MHWLNESSARRFHAEKEAESAAERAVAIAEKRQPVIKVATCPVCRTPITHMLKAGLWSGAG